MTGLVLLRLRAHRLLIAAALLTALLTTSALAALAAFSGSVGDAALRSTLEGRAKSSASLVVEADVPRHGRDAAQRAVERRAREAFDGLAVTVRRLERSGPYALPRSPQGADARAGQPDLTLLAALDRSRVELVAGTLPGPAPASRHEAVPVAVPEPAAHRLRLRPGARLTLTDRLGGEPVRVEVTGVYRAADGSDPYWQADTLGGQGVRTVVFTTYGPLLADAAVLASGRVTTGGTGWVATADHRGLTTGSLGALRAATVQAAARLRGEPALGGSADVRTGLPEVLDHTERALLVSRSTLLIASLQLVLLAGYALLLVARLLNGAREGETRLLRARGASRGRIASLAGLEALLLAVPAAVGAALLSGPLARLLAGWSSLDRIGLRLGTVPSGGVWLVAGGAALVCAVGVVAPALTGAVDAPARLRRVRAVTSAAPVRAGADLALLLIAGVAYWQLQRRTGVADGGVIGRDRAGRLGTDPLLVAAPALALLAGTVLTLRVLPFAARLAEQRSASGRGLPAALAGWRFSRRPLRGAGPVLLLIVAVATGMLAVGHGASWDRSQDDQADFRTGAAVRVLDHRPGSPGQTGLYAALPGAREAAPAHRAALSLSGDREATVLALDTSRAGDGMLMRGDLADEPPGELLRALAPPPTDENRAVRLPDGTRRLALDVRITDERARTGRSPSGRTPLLTVVVEDGYGIAYRLGAGNVPVDGRAHRVTLELDRTATGRRAAPAGPLRLTGLQLADTVPTDRSERHRFTVERLLATGPDGSARTVRAAPGTRWQGGRAVTRSGEVLSRTPVEPAASDTAPLSLSYATGADGDDGYGVAPVWTVRADTAGARAPRTLAAVATRDFLRASGAAPGDTVDVPLSGEQVQVRIVRAVRELPTTAAADTAGRSAAGGALLLDLRAVDAVLAQRGTAPLTPTEWWVSAEPGKAAEVAAALRARPDLEARQVLVRDETAADLLRDPLGAGPRSALTAVTVAAVALAAGGFAVSAAGARRERSAEFAVLRALGTPRRDLARLVVTEQSLLVGVGLLAGLALGTLLTRAVVPLIVLTSGAARPVPPVLVELPVGQVALLVAGVAAPLALITAASALPRAEPAVALRHQGED
ncbi:FtsX-like permease family protein [Streptomyces sp. MRC013]|uniref:FtsX-like permease family protein n=1 Tax=Streptomyces sp. MRC013 TaxID=2898276 RepID=UPI0020260A38|nr:FtsX-like permease family protein [Streptomyces sp. MRC013]URM88706.1 FtsX-like permease family protein [Streptomyces sp. MRC013]